MTDAARGQIVFTEIPAADSERARKFYETLLQAPLILNDNGPDRKWMLPGAEGAHPVGHIVPGKPATDGGGVTTHFAVTDGLADAMDRVRQGGGEILSGIIDIPLGWFFYATDSEGNRLGLFKYAN
ncbi:MAG: VOC family protein [Sphingomonadales bacterium]|nr:MAG: VOC family protein [Sphingomonadales bacterium]